MTTVCPSCAELLDTDDCEAVVIDRCADRTQYSLRCPECGGWVVASERAGAARDEEPAA